MAGGNRGGIVLPVAGCSELACNWNPASRELNAIAYKWAIVCPAGSAEHRGRPGRRFCPSPGHGKFGFQSRGRKRHLTCGGGTAGLGKEPPAWERHTGERKYHREPALGSRGAGGPGAALSPSKELSRLLLPASPTKQGRCCSPLLQTRQLRQRASDLPEVTLLPGAGAGVGSHDLWFQNPPPLQLCPTVSFSSSFPLSSSSWCQGHEVRPRALSPYHVKRQLGAHLPRRLCQGRLLCSFVRQAGGAGKLASPGGTAVGVSMPRLPGASGGNPRRCAFSVAQSNLLPSLLDSPPHSPPSVSWDRRPPNTFV